jgi:hypothetical protein
MPRPRQKKAKGRGGTGTGQITEQKITQISLIFSSPHVFITAHLHLLALAFICVCFRVSVFLSYGKNLKIMVICRITLEWL